MRHCIVVISVFILSTVLAFADIARPETVRDTLQLLKREFSRQTGPGSVEIDDEEVLLRLSLEGADDFVVYPDNLHRNLRGAELASERQAILEDFVLAMLELTARQTEEDPLDINMVIPVLRNADFGHSLSDTDPPVSTPFVGDLKVHYVINHPKTLSYINQAMLDKLGLDLPGLHDRAVLNLSDAGWQPTLEGDTIFFLTFDGTFEASFLLLDAVWNLIDEQLGSVVVMVLARDLVLVSDADWDGATDLMREVGDAFWDKVPYPLSRSVLRWTGDGWEIMPKQ